MGTEFASAILVARPAPGRRAAIALAAGRAYRLGFTLAEIQGRELVEEDLVLAFADGGVLVLEGFLAFFMGGEAAPLAITGRHGRPVALSDLAVAEEAEPLAAIDAGLPRGSAPFDTPFDPGRLGPGLDPLGPLPALWELSAEAVLGPGRHTVTTYTLALAGGPVTAQSAAVVLRLAGGARDDIQAGFVRDLDAALRPALGHGAVQDIGDGRVRIALAAGQARSHDFALPSVDAAIAAGRGTYRLELTAPEFGTAINPDLGRVEALSFASETPRWRLAGESQVKPGRTATYMIDYLGPPPPGGYASVRIEASVRGGSAPALQRAMLAELGHVVEGRPGLSLHGNELRAAAAALPTTIMFTLLLAADEPQAGDTVRLALKDPGPGQTLALGADAAVTAVAVSGATPAAAEPEPERTAETDLPPGLGPTHILDGPGVPMPAREGEGYVVGGDAGDIAVVGARRVVGHAIELGRDEAATAATGADGRPEFRLSLDELLERGDALSQFTVTGAPGDRLTADFSGHQVQVEDRGSHTVYIIDGGTAVVTVANDLQQNILGL